MKTLNLTDKGLDIKKAIENISDENIRQLKKWGEQEHTLFEWLAILAEEVGETNKAALEYDFLKAKQESIHVATVALKIGQMIDNKFEEMASKAGLKPGEPNA